MVIRTMVKNNHLRALPTGGSCADLSMKVSTSVEMDLILVNRSAVGEMWGKCGGNVGEMRITALTSTLRETCEPGLRFLQFEPSVAGARK